MKKLRITIKALGYETTSFEVEAQSAGKITWEQKQDAFRKFSAHNDISMGDAKGFGFQSITRSN